jgi:putative ABC transport system ATP-binding protein
MNTEPTTFASRQLTFKSGSDQGVTEVLISFLTLAAQQMSLDLDPVAVRRAIADMSGRTLTLMFDVEECSRQLEQTGSAFLMQIDRLSSDNPDVIRLVRPQAPIGGLWTDGKGEWRWVLLFDKGNGVVQMADSMNCGVVFESSPARLSQVMACCQSNVEWLSIQRSYLYSTPSHDHGQKTPFARYIELLAPERGDIGVILVFALFVGVLALSTPIAIESLVNTVAFGQLMQPVIVLALILFVFMAFSATMRALQTYVAEIIQRRLFVKVSADLAHRIPRVQTEYWQSHYGPEAINRFFEIVAVQKVTTQLLLDGTSLVLQTFVGMAVIAFYHPILLGFDAFLLLLMIAIVFLLGRNAISTSIDESRQKYAAAAWLEELARHPMLFRSRGGLTFALDRSDYFSTQYLNARSAHFHVLIRQIIAALFLQAVASTVLLGLGGWLVIQGELTLGQLVAAELIVTLIVGSFAKIGKQLEGFYDVMASMDKLGHLFDMPLERVGGIELPIQDAPMRVQIHDLDFGSSFGSNDSRSISFSIEPGEHVCLTGQPLEVTSEVLKSIVEFRTVPSGHIEMDGFDVRRLRLDCLREQVVLVKDIEIFSGTIAENIHLGREEVSESDLRRALQSVDLLDRVLDLPQGLASPIQTDGGHFSSEEIVKLVLARALAGRPRLLMVDQLLDRLSDVALPSIISGLLSPGFPVTVLVATGREHIARFFRRQIDISEEGVVEILPRRPQLTASTREKQ